MILNKQIMLQKIGDWGLGIVDWAQSPIPNPQSPIPIFLIKKIKSIFFLYFY